MQRGVTVCDDDKDVQGLEEWLSRFGYGLLLDQVLEAGLSAAVVLIDTDGRVRYLSPRAADWSDLDHRRAVGRPFTEVYASLGVPDPLQVLPQARGAPVERLAGRHHAPARLLAVQALTDREGQVAGALVVLREALETGAGGVLLQEDAIESFHGLVSRDPVMKQAFAIVRNVAQTDATVLIRGESGSGKELAARALHAESLRRDRPFLAINCAALSPALLESELFGHVRGAFTGALRDHAGLFQQADGGTLFLDEVAELPLELQAKLLRVLQEKSFMPVGGEKARSVDVRIVAATHRALREEVRKGRFREDLLYRLRVIPIFLPPLRERRADVPLLLRHFIARHNAAGARRVERISPEAMRSLLDYPWPGNVRELQNVVEYAFVVGRGAEIGLDDLPPEFREPRRQGPAAAGRAGAVDAHDAGEDEAARLRAALELTGGQVQEAAARLGMSRATFWRKRKKWGI